MTNQEDQTPELNQSESLKAVKQYPPLENWRILKNIFVLGFSVALHFLYIAVSTLQSSLHTEHGLGTTGMACSFIGSIFGNLFLPAFFVRYLGCKWTICMCILMSIPYMIAQSFPSFWTIPLTGLINGLFGGPLSVAHSTYTSIMGEVYSRITSKDKEEVLSRFFTIIHLFLQLPNFIGNGITTGILSSDSKIVSREDFDYHKYCGSNFCPYVTIENATAIIKPTRETMYIMTGVFIVPKIFSVVLVALFLDPLARYSVFDARRDSLKLKGFQLLLVTLQNLRDRKQQLLVFLSLWIGTINSFSLAEYPMAYITCGWGIQYVGYVKMSYGLAAVLIALIVSWVGKYIHRSILICVAMVVSLVNLIVLRIWTPTPYTSVVYFVVAMLMGGCWNINYPLNYASASVLFKGKQEGAFSNIALWLAIGSVMGFLYNPHICADIKIYICMILNILGVVCYIFAEILYKKSQERTSELENSEEVST